MVMLYVLAFCRIAIGLVFGISFLSKVIDIPTFKRTMSQFAILPKQLTRFVALLFLMSECVAVLLLIVGGIFLVPGFLLAICLLLLFCTALVTVLVRRIRTSCNCFGPSTKQVSHWDIWRNIGLILCAFGGCTALAWAKDTQEALNALGWVFTGLGAVVFVVIWIWFGEIVQLFRRG
jgi:uncharacterized membrane protein YphA (DoxX/SURF4 family)